MGLVKICDEELFETTHKDKLFSERKNFLIENLLKIKKKRFYKLKVLDVGSNSGDLCNELQKIGVNPYGVEINENLLKLSNKKYPSLKFKYADIQKEIPFEDNFFDIIWIGDVIEHLYDTKSFLQELRRVLRTDGTIILTTPYHGLIKNIVIAFTTFNTHYHPEHVHIRYYTEKTLNDQLEENRLYLVSLKKEGRCFPLYKNMFCIIKKY